MKARIRCGAREIWDGDPESHDGRNELGEFWKRIWTVEVDCDSEREAMKLVDEIRNRKEAAA